MLGVFPLVGSCGLLIVITADYLGHYIYCSVVYNAGLQWSLLIWHAIFIFFDSVVNIIFLEAIQPFPLAANIYNPRQNVRNRGCCQLNVQQMIAVFVKNIV